MPINIGQLSIYIESINQGNALPSWELLVRIAARGCAGERADLATCGGELRAGNRLPNAVTLDSAGPPCPESDVIPERFTHSELGRDRWSSEGGLEAAPCMKTENAFNKLATVWS